MEYLAFYLIPMFIVITLAYLHRKELSDADMDLCTTLAIIPVLNLPTALMMTVTSLRDYLKKEDEV